MSQESKKDINTQNKDVEDSDRRFKEFPERKKLSDFLGSDIV